MNASCSEHTVSLQPEIGLFDKISQHLGIVKLDFLCFYPLLTFLTNQNACPCMKEIISGKPPVLLMRFRSVGGNFRPQHIPIQNVFVIGLGCWGEVDGTYRTHGTYGQGTRGRMGLGHNAACCPHMSYTSYYPIVPCP